MSVNLIRQLDALGEVVAERFPYINRGGCCVYAALVAEKLQRYGIPVWGIVSGYDDDTIDDLTEIRLNEKPENTVYGWNESGVYFRHVMVQFVIKGKVWTYDSNGTLPEIGDTEPSCGGRLYSGNLTVTELRELAAGPGWTSMFDRRGIPALQLLVDQYLSLEAITKEEPIP